MFSHLDQNPSIQIQMRMGLKGRHSCLFVNSNGFGTSYRNFIDRTSLIVLATPMKMNISLASCFRGKAKFPIQYFFSKCVDARSAKVQGFTKKIKSSGNQTQGISIVNQLC